MTGEEKITLVKAMTNKSDTDVINAYLLMAAESIYNYVDPYRYTTMEAVTEKYGSVQVRAAAYLLNKHGADGQTAHDENGVSRSYEAGDLPASLLRELTPICGVVK